VLAGDASAFATLASATAAARHAATLQAQYGAIIDEADRAWEAKDRDRAAALYETAEAALDDVRRRRLKYARRRKK
jgi:hypothetical protein